MGLDLSSFVLIKNFTRDNRILKYMYLYVISLFIRVIYIYIYDTRS